LIAWLLFSKASTDFEKITVSILLIIYAHIITSVAGIAYTTLLVELKSAKRFLNLLQILKRHDPVHKLFTTLNENSEDDYEENDAKKEPSEMSLADSIAELHKKFEPPLKPEFDPVYHDDQETERTLKEDEDDVKKCMVQMYIVQTFASIIYVLAGVSILSVFL